MDDLIKLIYNNIAILDAELDNEEELAEQKLERQLAALRKLYDEIKITVTDSDYRICMTETRKYNIYKPKCSEDQWNRKSEELAKMIKIDFPEVICLENTGESEDYYFPRVRKHDREHSSSYSSAYIKISWDDAKGVYLMVPNVAYNWNEEREDVDKRVYLELQGTKDMIIERLAVVLASVMRLEREFNKASSDNRSARINDTLAKRGLSSESTLESTFIGDDIGI